MNRQPVLSICIPTYNRGSLLEQSIQYMIPVCQKNNILIFVSDNASPDNTEIIMRQLAREYDFIHYYRHLDNIGPDDNFEYVLKMSDTKYRWLMSDTCFVADVDNLMQDLELGDWDGYIVNGDSYRAIQLPKKKVIYGESISLMKDIGWHLTWISCMIYNERLINSLNFERYKNSCFNQTALMFEPTANRECKICFNPSIVVDSLPVGKESGWTYHIFDIMYRQWYLLIMSFPIYYPYEIKKQCIVDAAKKPVLLGTYYLLRRRMEGKWSFCDVYRNKFFIKQAHANFFLLLILGACPKFFLKLLINSGHQLNNCLRFIGFKVSCP